MAPSRNTGFNPRVIKALAHPLRMELLAALNKRVASPKELAEELGERLPNVSYHVRVLLDAECIELVRTEPRRGALEHFYRAQMRPIFADEEWAKLPRSTRRSVSDVVLSQIWADTAEATRAGTFDARDDRHLSRSKLVLDEQGWTELNELLADTLHRAHDIQSESVTRLHAGVAGDAAAAGIYAHLVMMHYTGDPSDDDKPVAEEPARSANQATS